MTAGADGTAGESVVAALVGELRRVVAARHDREPDPELVALVDRLGSALQEGDRVGAPAAPPPARHARPALDHVGIAVDDLAAAAALFATGLGGSLVAGGLEPGTGLRSVHVAYPGGGKVELLQPTGPGPVADFLARRGQGVHHLTVLVDDVPSAVARLTSEGHEMVGTDTTTAAWHESYLSPRSAMGCLVQLVRPGPDYGRPTAVAIDDVVADRWAWVDRRPRWRG
jgi:methylmalonyl-CoA/ethylmalonyl-CoA epimerase